MNYRVFLLKSNKINNAVFLFNFKQDPNIRPQKGDVLTQPVTFAQFKILRDEVALSSKNIFRITDDGRRRITDDGRFRVIQIASDPDLVTHDFYVTPANNPQRISSYSTNTFDDDQVLRQLFR